jgi:hypothetical protein
MQGGMAALEGSMLALDPAHAPREGEPSPLATQDAEVARMVRVRRETGV